MEPSALIFMGTCWILIASSAVLTMTKIVKSQNNGGNS